MKDKTLHYISWGFAIKSPCGFNRFAEEEYEDIDRVTNKKEKVTCKRCLHKISGI